MKAFAKFLTFLTVLALLGCGYLYMSRVMRVTNMDFALVSAADRAEEFAQYREAAAVGDENIVMRESFVADDPAAYNFAVIKFTVTNWSPLPAEWIQLDVELLDGDIMQIKIDAGDIPAFTQADISTLLLCDWGVSDFTRAAKLTYYIYGNPVEIDLKVERAEQ